jgi:hypothetical protein
VPVFDRGCERSVRFNGGIDAPIRQQQSDHVMMAECRCPPDRKLLIGGRICTMVGK